MYKIKVLFLFYISMSLYVNAQEDSTTVKLDKIEIKSIGQNNLVAHTNKVDSVTLLFDAGKDLAHQLESLPGVIIRKSGSNISKPIIDGLSSSRIVYMVNGVRLENQDWADAHSPEIDADIVSNLEVIRGAETVKYGSNALGGVINVGNDKIPKNTHINGKFKAFFIGNTQGYGASMSLQQNLKYVKGLSWRIHANKTANGDYKTSEYNVANSGTRLETYSGELSYKFKNLEIETFYYRYKSKQGNYFGALTGNIDEFEERIELGRPLVIIPYNFSINVPSQESKHEIFDTKIKFRISNHLYANAQYSHQVNHREEFDVRRSASNSVPVQDMLLTSNHIITELNYNKYNYNAVFGFQVREKENYNNPATGVTPSLPNYIYEEKSLYSNQSYKINQWFWNAGVRYDRVISKARGINFLRQLYGKEREFSAFSAQAAGNYGLNNWNCNSSISYGWRVPEFFELYANGIQHGVPIYFVGNSDFKAEKGFKWMNTIQYHTERSHTELQGFYNRLDNYIYAIPTHEFKQLFSGAVALFQFKQQDAAIYGIDLIQHTELARSLELTNHLSIIKGEEIISKTPLPNISSWRLNNTIRYQFNIQKRGVLLENSIQLHHAFVSKKRNYNPAYELSLDVPDAYNLFNIGYSTNYHINQSKTVVVSFVVDNVLNVAYKDYLNLHRYFVHDRGRSINANIQFQF